MAEIWNLSEGKKKKNLLFFEGKPLADGTCTYSRPVYWLSENVENPHTKILLQLVSDLNALCQEMLKGEKINEPLPTQASDTIFPYFEVSSASVCHQPMLVGFWSLLVYSGAGFR